MTELISIIIPIYNMEKYLERCIKSVLSQTYENFELICVNDGSTDGSLAILNRFANEDKRIIVKNKINGGVSSARNEGLKTAGGGYITFIDPDDWIHPMYLEILLKACSLNSSDISICNMQRVESETMISGKNDVKDYRFVNQGYDQFVKTYKAVCGHLFKSYLLEGVSFPEGVRYAEDLFFNYELLNRNGTVKTTLAEVSLYYYFQHETSTCHDKNQNDRILAISHCIDKLYKSKSNYTYLFFDLALKTAYSYWYYQYVYGELKITRLYISK